MTEQPMFYAERTALQTNGCQYNGGMAPHGSNVDKWGPCHGTMSQRKKKEMHGLCIYVRSAYVTRSNGVATIPPYLHGKYQRGEKNWRHDKDHCVVGGSVLNWVAGPGHVRNARVAEARDFAEEHYYLLHVMNFLLCRKRYLRHRGGKWGSLACSGLSEKKVAKLRERSAWLCLAGA